MEQYCKGDSGDSTAHQQISNSTPQDQCTIFSMQTTYTISCSRQHTPSPAADSNTPSPADDSTHHLLQLTAHTISCTEKTYTISSTETTYTIYSTETDVFRRPWTPTPTWRDVTLLPSRYPAKYHLSTPESLSDAFRALINSLVCWFRKVWRETPPTKVPISLKPQFVNNKMVIIFPSICILLARGACPNL